MKALIVKVEKCTPILSAHIFKIFLCSFTVLYINLLSKFIVKKLVTESVQDNRILRHLNVFENKMCSDVK